VKKDEIIVKRQKVNTWFKNADMDFMFNWEVGVSEILGMSPAQVFLAVHDVKDGDPVSWRAGFRRQADYQARRGQELAQAQQAMASGQFYLGAAYAYKAAVQYTDPTTAEYGELIQAMEAAFQHGIESWDVPARTIEIPFENTSLPGYYLEIDDQPRPVVLMIGGGDSFREDLFYFAGYPGWKRGYNVLMVDLPGQGVMPGRGQPFRADMDRPISIALDWLESNAAVKPAQIAIYGVSGGGYFSAQGAAADPRLGAWIAATPIYDIVKIFQREFGPALKAPGWLLNALMRLSGTFNKSNDINLKKYAWQFGSKDFKSAIAAVIDGAQPVDYTKMTVPSLFLMSEGEAPELQRQTREVFDNFEQRGVDVTLREFLAAEGADGHCQLNNLRLAHHVIFDWLDRLFDHEPGDVRLRC
jgi:hypothetical protein